MKASRFNFGFNIFFAIFDLVLGLYDLIYFGAIQNYWLGWVVGPFMFVLMFGMIWLASSDYKQAKRWGWK